MIYVISKATFGSYNVRDIQCNANWDCCPYSDYALIPDRLVEGILATKGYCDITLNGKGTEVVSYTARAIPSVQEECCAEDQAATAPKTAKGSVVSVSDSSDAPLHSLKLYGKTTQDGTPSPDSPAALKSVGDGGSIGVTVAGKNLFQVSKPYNKDGSFSITAGETAVAGIYKNLTGTIPAGTYTVSYLNGYGVLYVMLSENDYTSPIKVGGFKTFAYDGVSFLRLVSDNVPANTTKTYKIQLERGATATEFEPHKTKQLLTAATPNGLPGIPVTSGGNCTDENGQQWLSDVRDYGQGVSVKNVPCVNMSDLFYVADSNGVFHAALPYPAITTGYDEATAQHLMCNTLPAITRRACTSGSQGVTLSGNYIYVCVPGCTTTAELQAWFTSHPTQVVYRPATIINEPTPIPDSEMSAFAALHTNKPNTTVYNDAWAHMEIGYYTPISALPVAGGAMGGNLRMSGNKITDLGTPTLDTDAANKAYVDSASRVVNGVEEWINPPMMIGVEYRTTERYEGKAVYAKLVDFGTLPNATSKMAAYCGTGSTGAVSVKALLSDGCVLGEGYGKDTRYSSAYGVYIDNTLYNVQITAESDFSGLSAKILVKYTKD